MIFINSYYFTDLQFARIIDSAGSDIGNGVACDPNRNVYITGTYNGTATVKNQSGASLGTYIASTAVNAFMSKFSTVGDYLSTTYISGTLANNGYSVACDPTGNVYIGGTFTSNPATVKNTDGTTLATFPAPLGGQSAFLCKLDVNGTYVNFRIIDANGSLDNIFAVACDPTGNVYTFGQYLGASTTIKDQDGITLATLPNAPGNNGHMSKFDVNGNYLYSRVLITSTLSLGGTADITGNSYVCGYYDGTPNITDQAGTVLTTLIASVNDIAFVSKFNQPGTYLYSRFIDGSTSDRALATCCDSSLNMYVSGFYNTSATIKNQAGTSLGTLPAVTGSSCFVCKFNSTGVYQFSRIIDSAGTDSINGVNCDSTGNVYVTGSYIGTPTIKNQAGTTLGTLPASGAVSFAFLSKFDSSGNYLYSRVLASSGNSSGEGVTCDTSGNVYFAGNYNGTGNTIKDQAGTTLGTLPDTTGNSAFLIQFDSEGTYSTA